MRIGCVRPAFKGGIWRYELVALALLVAEMRYLWKPDAAYQMEGEVIRLVILESPYAGDVEENIAYALECVKDSLMRNEAPIASHLVYPRVLDDTIPEERQRGIDAGLAWKKVAHASVVYIDRGITSGMRYGITAAQDAGIPVEFRRLPIGVVNRLVN